MATTIAYTYTNEQIQNLENNIRNQIVTTIEKEAYPYLTGNDLISFVNLSKILNKIRQYSSIIINNEQISIGYGERGIFDE